MSGMNAAGILSTQVYALFLKALFFKMETAWPLLKLGVVLALVRLAEEDV